MPRRPRVNVICDNCGKAFTRPPSSIRAKTVFCSLSCSGIFHTRRNTPERFWEQIDVGQPEECWEWKGTRLLSGGYGVTCWNGKLIRAHRLALALTDGDWESRLHVLHRCDNPPCCNPSHLWRGTDAENAKDRDSKGRYRQAPLKTHCPRGHEYTPANTYIRKDGHGRWKRTCRACDLNRKHEIYYGDIIKSRQAKNDYNRRRKERTAHP